MPVAHKLPVVYCSWFTPCPRFRSWLTPCPVVHTPLVVHTSLVVHTLPVVHILPGSKLPLVHTLPIGSLLMVHTLPWLTPCPRFTTHSSHTALGAIHTLPAVHPLLVVHTLPAVHTLLMVHTLPGSPLVVHTARGSHAPGGSHAARGSTLPVVHKLPTVHTLPVDYCPWFTRARSSHATGGSPAHSVAHTTGSLLVVHTPLVVHSGQGVNMGGLASSLKEHYSVKSKNLPVLLGKGLVFLVVK